MSSELMSRIIPCLDVDNGRVVKGTQFVELRDMGDPVELAIEYEQQGADELVFLDISASHEKRPTALKTVTRIAEHLSIPFTVGGGLKKLEDVKSFLDAGADKVALNTTAIYSPEIIDQVAHAYGSQCIVVAIDIKQEQQQRAIYSHGGRTKTDKEFTQWSHEVAERGAGEILLTAMHKDGTGSGFDCDLIDEISALNIQVIASGGAKSEQDFLTAFNAGYDACLAAGMFHSGDYKIQEIKSYLKSQGVNVRI
ncbi:imidazole glycerol phosphate synthase subunit HisF [Pleionea sp. CnH1-48]|uniref:imidazole glycerol phosphate synthase subunit HisF n=1 Tax=Pleionea sp. CnH1-48 TaxID=2954494 RepID=UPI0020985090|nr:imidazole glycerol phosphate synthase subunit HisF [Pleionea sp. CnH1-48]MCO7223093.1 imidazole glycerol phosphate synthase subunit HisF [Pleionea sp. CnH1-48]